MDSNTVCGTREALPLAWRRIARSSPGAPEGHDRGARVPGVGPLQLRRGSQSNAGHPRGPAEQGEGRELAKGNVAG